MKISNEELKTIFYGGYTFGETDDGYLHSYQHTQEQMEYFKAASDFWYVRSMAGNGKTLEFITQATEFSFEYKFLWTGAVDSIEIMIDGVIKKIYHPDELPPAGKISYTMEPGEKTVVVYLVADTEIVIRNFEINAPFKHVTKGEKVLWLGDSITQGYGPYRSAHTYVNVANRILNYDIINQGIGGYVYDKGSLMKMEGYTPDKIIVALGTNQFKTATRDCVEEYYERLTQLYPGIPVICITPLYRDEEKEVMDKLVEFSNVIKDVCKNYPDVTVINGFTLMGNTKEYLLDNVHPNVLGCEVFGRNLAEAIRNLNW